ncbi:MAG: YeeE/YedE family protein [Thermorudis peleae]|nr:YeeE/YedE family protein [Thermorudis peleae]
MQRTETFVRPRFGYIVGDLPSPRFGVAIGAAGVAVVLAAVLVSRYGVRQGILFALGLLLGITLYHARFGFTSAFRQFVAVGQGAGLRAHMLMLAVASVLFAPILASGKGLFGVHVAGSLAPVGLAVLVGAFLFGVGMQLGGACASGTLFSVGGGQTATLFTLAGFIVGSVLGAWHWGFWTQPALNLPALSLATVFGGYFGALIVQLGVIGAITLVTILIERKRRPPQIAPQPSARGLARVIRGTWPLWTGAVVLAVLNAATLLVSGHPWGITSAFALWGSKLAQALGVNVSSWAYWSGSRAASLRASVLADVTSVMDFGIVLGAMIAAALSGTFVLHRHLPLKTVIASLLGGVLMGYGARLAYGCNIGAYFSGVASFSLHGWIWAIAALLGTTVGVRLRPLFGLTVPKQTDAVC